MSTNTSFIAALISISIFLTACIPDLNAETPIQTVPFSIIVAGDHTLSGTFENRKLEVFRDQTSLDASLALYVQSIQQHVVDFSTQQAVLINIGQRNSGGYSVSTDQILEFSDHLKVKITLTKPGNGCATTLALTSPFEFIEAQSTKEIIFEQTLVTIDCI